MLIAHAAFASPAGFDFTVEVTEEELQSKVQALMPLEINKLGVVTLLSNSTVLIENDPKLLTVISDVGVTLPNGLSYSGRVKMNASLIYQPESFSFFLKDVKIIEMTVERLQEPYLPIVRNFAQIMAVRIFSTHPIYTLKSDSVKNRLVKSTLKSVTIEDKKIVLSFGLFS